jgi:hypothetical protein
MLNNHQDGRASQQEQERQHNATHPRVAMLKNTNIEKEKLARQASRRETTRSQSVSSGKRVHYSEVEEYERRNHHGDRDDYTRNMSPSRRNYYDGRMEDDYDRPMSPIRRMDHDRPVSPSRRMDYGSH